MTQFFDSMNRTSMQYLALITMLLASISTYAQNANSCSISIDGTDKGVSILGAPRSVAVLAGPATTFSNIDLVSGVDGRSAVADIPAGRTTASLYVSDFGLNIPQGVNLMGIELIVTGSSSDPGALRDATITLASGAGSPIGNNRANRTTANQPWQDDDIWIYGSQFDFFGTALSVSQLNQSNFGAIIQVRNAADSAVTAMIDQVAIRVHYQAALEICGHPCVAIQSTPQDDVIRYDWNVDNTLVWSASNELDHVVNIFAEDSPLGTYDVCLTRTFITGETDQCCRPLNYTTCETGSIGDRIWQDLNANGLQDPGEPDLDGITIFLYDASGRFLESTVSRNGRYLFSGLSGGLYVVRAIVEDNSTSPFVEGNPDNNSDITNTYSFGSTGVINLSHGEDIDNVDLGLTIPGAICGSAFRDRDGNGAMDTSGEIIPGTVISLFDANNNLLSTVEVDQDGGYTFDGLSAGQYFIEFGLPIGIMSSGFSANGPFDPLANRIEVNLESGEKSEENNVFGFVPSSIGDLVLSLIHI